MQYTNVTNVRRASGFVGNSNIADAVFSDYINRVDSMINSKIGDVYSLPLPKFYKNTIVFSGTGSGSGTMTITINGSNYVIAISSSLSASAAADLFRSAASGNSDFVVDNMGNGATVSLYSATQNEDSLEVAVTSTDPQTVTGITATEGTVTEVAIPLIESLSTQMAAAYVLIQEYGPESQNSDKDGFNRLDIWKKTLDRISKAEEKLYDFAGRELPISTTKQLSFYPNASSSADIAENPTTPKFTMSKKF